MGFCLKKQHTGLHSAMLSIFVILTNWRLYKVRGLFSWSSYA